MLWLTYLSFWKKKQAFLVKLQRIGAHLSHFANRLEKWEATSFGKLNLQHITEHPSKDLKFLIIANMIVMVV